MELLRAVAVGGGLFTGIVALAGLARLIAGGRRTYLEVKRLDASADFFED